MTTGQRFERAVEIMHRLRAPGGCPWDREQTFDSITKYTVEETYEVLEAIEQRDWQELPQELGDLLLQVLFYAEMATEDGHFSIDTVLDTLSDKLPDFGGKNVTAVVSQTVAHRELLRQVCGHVVDLQRLDADAAATAVLATPVRLVRVNGTGIAEVQGIGATADGRVSIHGKLTADEASLRLEYSDGHKSPPIKLVKKSATNGALIASVWAAQRVNQLAIRAEANEDELLTLGRRFGIVSPATSLIVLENLLVLSFFLSAKTSMF